ncbi:glutamate racemase [Saccharobesus litoralis]|nr:glutamate racemase [Saccharobesus litoralis]
MTNKQPIGVFDSGIGGLSVLRELTDLLPQQDFIYVSDSQYAPYGLKTTEQVWQRCCVIVDFLLKQKVQAIVIACNTATVAVIDRLRLTYDIPFVGIEPAVKPALNDLARPHVAVLATHNTINSNRLNKLVASYSQQHSQVSYLVCNGWVELVEQGVDKSVSSRIVKSTLQSLIVDKPDTLVLACTHYPFLQNEIAACFDYPVHIIEPGKAVAKRVQDLLKITADPVNQTEGEVTYFTSGSVELTQRNIARLLGKDSQVHTLNQFG